MTICAKGKEHRDAGSATVLMGSWVKTVSAPVGI